MGSNRTDVVLVRVGAIFVLVYSLQSLTSYAAFYQTTEDLNSQLLIAFLLNFGLPIIIVALLWFFPKTLIGASATTTDTDGTIADGTRLGVVLVGLYALVFGIVDLAFYESLRLFQQQYGGANTPVSPEVSAGRVTNLVQIVIGILLLVGRQRIVNILNSARKAGVSAS